MKVTYTYTANGDMIINEPTKIKIIENFNYDEPYQYYKYKVQLIDEILPELNKYQYTDSIRPYYLAINTDRNNSASAMMNYEKGYNNYRLPNKFDLKQELLIPISFDFKIKILKGHIEIVINIKNAIEKFLYNNFDYHKKFYFFFVNKIKDYNDSLNNEINKKEFNIEYFKSRDPLYEEIMSYSNNKLEEKYTIQDKYNKAIIDNIDTENILSSLKSQYDNAYNNSIQENVKALNAFIFADKIELNTLSSLQDLNAKKQNLDIAIAIANNATKLNKLRNSAADEILQKINLLISTAAEKKKKIDNPANFKNECERLAYDNQCFSNSDYMFKNCKEVCGSKLDTDKTTLNKQITINQKLLYTLNAELEKNNQEISNVQANMTESDRLTQIEKSDYDNNRDKYEKNKLDIEKLIKSP